MFLFDPHSRNTDDSHNSILRTSSNMKQLESKTGIKYSEKGKMITNFTISEIKTNFRYITSIL